MPNSACRKWRTGRGVCSVRSIYESTCVHVMDPHGEPIEAHPIPPRNHRARFGDQRRCKLFSCLGIIQGARFCIKSPSAVPILCRFELRQVSSSCCCPSLLCEVLLKRSKNFTRSYWCRMCLHRCTATIVFVRSLTADQLLFSHAHVLLRTLCRVEELKCRAGSTNVALLQKRIFWKKETTKLKCEIRTWLAAV